jgi:hypothetical protein
MNGQGNPQILMVDHDGGWVPTAIAMADLENTDLLLKVQDLRLKSEEFRGNKNGKKRKTKPDRSLTPMP